MGRWLLSFHINESAKHTTKLTANEQVQWIRRYIWKDHGTKSQYGTLWSSLTWGGNCNQFASTSGPTASFTASSEVMQPCSSCAIFRIICLLIAPAEQEVGALVKAIYTYVQSVFIWLHENKLSTLDFNVRMCRASFVEVVVFWYDLSIEMMLRASSGRLHRWRCNISC